MHVTSIILEEICSGTSGLRTAMIRTSARFISPVYPAFGGIPGADQADGDRFGNRRAIGRIAIYHPTFSVDSHQ